jgi:hypothetical protein
MRGLLVSFVNRTTEEMRPWRTVDWVYHENWSLILVLFIDSIEGEIGRRPQRSKT